jgi:hypothetical protein
MQFVAELPQLASLEKGSAPAPIKEALGAWSSDLLARLGTALEVDYRAGCPATPAVAALLLEIRRTYLTKLGLPAAEFPPDKVGSLFSALVVQSPDLDALRKKLAAGPLDVEDVPLVERAFGSAGKVAGVWVVGGSAAVRATLQTWRQVLCDAKSPCPFWDIPFLGKVVITSQKGIAAYVPELATIVASEELFAKPHLLHQLVFSHELGHVAERSARIREKQDWTKSFAEFSGWSRQSDKKWTAQVKEIAPARQDKLTELSAGSSFSLLPDPVLVGERSGKPLDGYVLAKSYRESVEHSDPAEDLADSLVVYRLFPERFCFDGKPLAPRKYAWIARQIAGVKRATLQCPPPKGPDSHG